MQPQVIPLPESVEPEPVAKVEPLAPVNDLVAGIASVSQVAEYDTQAAMSLTAETQSKRDDDDALALIM